MTPADTTDVSLPSIATAFSIEGDWTLAIAAGRYRAADSVVTVAAAQRLDVPPAVVMHVVAERYASLPLLEPTNAPWRRGERLRHSRAQEVGVQGALAPDTLRLTSEPTGGTVFVEGRDYALDLDWGTVGRLEEGRMGEDQPVYAEYRCGAPTTSTVYLDRDGVLGVTAAQTTQTLPVDPVVPGGATRLATIWLPPRAPRLTAANLYVITETAAASAPCIAVSPERAERCLPRSRAKLRAGEPLRILAWGDSVTDGNYLVGGPTERWQEQLVRRLPPRVREQVELHTVAWGGRTTKAFLTEPSGSEYNFREQVLARKPDLVISEFVNDCGMSRELWLELYPRVMMEFRAIGTEWLILTPHYTRPDWMQMADQRDCDDDPRPYVAWLREFTTQHDLGLGDASRLWGRLWRQGIPYRTLLGNDINHPDARGLALYADAILPWLTV